MSVAQVGVVAQKPSDLNDLRQYFKSLAGGPYTYIQGANTDMTVGTLIGIADHTEFFLRRAQSCFSQDFLNEVVAHSGTLNPIEVNRTAKLDLDAGLDASRIGPVTADIKAEFQRKGIRTIEIKYAALSRVAIEIDALKNQMTKVMDEGCRSSFLSKKDNRFVIVETLSAKEYEVRFTNESGSDISVSAKVFTTLFPRFKSSSSSEITGSQKVQTTEPVIVAIKTIKPRTAVDKFSSEPLDLVTVPPDRFYEVSDVRATRQE
jgi:hypothetical protein